MSRAVATLLALACLSACASEEPAAEPVTEAPPVTPTPDEPVQETPAPPRRPVDVPEPISIGDDLDTDVIYSHGPAKLMMPEQILSAYEKLTGHVFDRGNPEYSVLSPESAKLNAAFVSHCQAMGGCPDHVTRERVHVTSILHVLTLDRAAIEACVIDSDATLMLPPDAPLADDRPEPKVIEDAIAWQYQHFFGLPPRSEEMNASWEYVTQHLLDEPNTLESALRGHCVALLTSAKFLYY